MRPSRNAFIGYTYQEQITFLFLVMMDVERKFNSLEIEADVENNFDDIKIQNGDDSMFFQIKDYDEINKVYSHYFISEQPAREAIEVSFLPKNVNVEISVIAVK